ncbi:MAG TPA: response regulator [Gemmatimonadales bacterium]|nr:response regulator [Gemmatimonadales bacterium]
MAKSVLIIDDDPDVRELLGQFFADQGFVVHVARDGRHALQLLAKIGAPDVILLDYLMPGMSGSQFLERKRRNPRIRCIPVVVLSTWTREWIPSRLDAVEVLSKPIDLERLLELVRHICDGSHAVHVHVRARRGLVGGRRLEGGLIGIAK